MKLILRADVEKLGSLGDLVSVKAGYGRNYLIPQGFAMLATPSNLKVFEMERRKLQIVMNGLRTDAAGIAARLEDFVLDITMRVGENDKLYGSVTSSMIHDLLEEKGIVVERNRILLETPIRSLGNHAVRVRLHADIIPTFTVKVIGEDRSLAGEVVEEVVAEVIEEIVAEVLAEVTEETAE